MGKLLKSRYSIPFNSFAHPVLRMTLHYITSHKSITIHLLYFFYFFSLVIGSEEHYLFHLPRVVSYVHLTLSYGLV